MVFKGLLLVTRFTYAHSLKNNVVNISGSQTFDLLVGNPNVNDIISYINSVLQPANVLSCTYDNINYKLHLQDSYHKQQQTTHFILTLLKLVIF